jgi:DNA polymerase-3 subunit epsilon
VIPRMYFDTETTGLLNFRAPLHHPDQPRIVQYAAILLAPDWTELASVNLLRKPNGWEIPAGASAVHGITTPKASAYGCELLTILACFQAFCNSAVQLVAHNMDFDLKVIGIEAAREKLTLDISDKKIFCTMLGSMNICKLPGRHGQYKWPKLSEAYNIFFGEELQGAHDALVDVRACARVHRHMIENKLIEDVKLH